MLLILYLEFIAIKLIASVIKLCRTKFVYDVILKTGYCNDIFLDMICYHALFKLKFKT